MLFYASEKYPEEDSYSKYITEVQYPGVRLCSFSIFNSNKVFFLMFFLFQHGGSTNASTSSERTVFHFDVNVDSIEEALDR